jgi:hypothetical protein
MIMAIRCRLSPGYFIGEKMKRLILLLAMLPWVAVADYSVEIRDLELYQSKFEYSKHSKNFKLGQLLYTLKPSQIEITTNNNCIDDEFPGSCQTVKTLKKDEVFEVTVFYDDGSFDGDQNYETVNLRVSNFPASVVSELKELSKSCIFCNHSKRMKARSKLLKQWVKMDVVEGTKLVRDPIYACNDDEDPACWKVIGYGKPYSIKIFNVEVLPVTSQ